MDKTPTHSSGLWYALLAIMLTALGWMLIQVPGLVAIWFGVFSMLCIPAALLQGRAERQRSAALTSCLATAAKHNLPLAAMLRAASTSERGKLAETMGELHRALAAGDSLGDALARHANDFAEDRTRWIAAAEKMGRMGPVLISMQRRDRLATRLFPATQVSGVSYALTIGGGLLLFAGFFAGVIQPRYTELLEDFRVSAPWATRLMGDLLERVGVLPFVLGAGVLLGAGFFLPGFSGLGEKPGGAQAGGQSRWGGPLVWRIPLLGSVIQHRAWARAFELTAEAVTAGQNLPEALHGAADTMRPAPVARRIRAVARRLDAGEDAAVAIRGRGWPRMAAGLLPTAVRRVGTRRDAALSVAVSRHAVCVGAHHPAGGDGPGRFCGGRTGGGLFRHRVFRAVGAFDGKSDACVGAVMKRRYATRSVRRLRGMMVLEATLGLSLLAILVGVWVAGQRQQRMAASALKVQRVAARNLEAAALRWSAGERALPTGLDVETRGDGWIRLSTGGRSLWVFSPGAEAGGGP